jgi:hypothetical protein
MNCEDGVNGELEVQDSRSRTLQVTKSGQGDMVAWWLEVVTTTTSRSRLKNQKSPNTSSIITCILNAEAAFWQLTSCSCQVFLSSLKADPNLWW